MAKRHLLIDSREKIPPKQPKTATNWDLCALCQISTSEALQCPAKSTKKPTGAGYVSLAEDLLQYKDLAPLQKKTDLDRLDDGNGFQQTFMTNNAKWHKSCRIKFNQNEIRRLQKASEKEVSPCASGCQTRATDQLAVESEQPACFFCNEVAGSGTFHVAATKQLDVNVRKCAIQLEDTKLLAKLVPADMIALGAKYHLSCLNKLYNRARLAISANSNDDDETDLHSMALAELVAFMEEMRDDECSPVFKMADLGDMYKKRLEELGASKCGVHTTRQKTGCFHCYLTYRLIPKEETFC